MNRQIRITLWALQVLLVLAIGAGLRHQLSRERQAHIRRSRTVAEAIGRHAAEFFSGIEAKKEEFSLRNLNAYLDSRLGPNKLFEEDLRRPASFEIYRLADLKLGRIRAEIVGSVDFERSYTVQEEGANLTVTVPFALKEDGDYYGIVRIPTPESAILSSLVEKNFAVYLTVLFLFGAQFILSYLLLTRRRRDIIFEQGYLKDHALGALKLQRQILDGIIQDHEDLATPSGKKAAGEAATGEADRSNVVPFADKLRGRD